MAFSRLCVPGISFDNISKEQVKGTQWDRQGSNNFLHEQLVLNSLTVSQNASSYFSSIQKAFEKNTFSYLVNLSTWLVGFKAVIKYVVGTNPNSAVDNWEFESETYK